MKTRTLWINFITHERKRNLRWKPWFLRTNMVYDLGGKSWLAPMWEIGWLFFVFHWTAYNLKKEYKHSPISYHECPEELMQERINELEGAIRAHRASVPEPQSMQNDRDLWAALRD